VFLAVLAMSRIVAAPSMTLLYAGLESGAAGDVVRALEQRGVAFEVRGGAIFVDSKERDQLRLTLASEGLPANSSKGYELLDTLSGFGTTSQMFDAAYWRAKEGELARTIVSSPNVSFARVHIASTGSNPFQRGVTPTASVQITPNGGEIAPGHAKAIRYLVASAVAGLNAEDVAVIDANGVLLGNIDDVPDASDDDKANAMKARVERLLEARVGFGNAFVEVSVETDNQAEEIREKRFDPESRVAISTETEERTSTSNESGGGDVTVASNLPDQEGGGGDSANSQDSETRERVNYEVSETERSVVRTPGAIKRMTVAVLVNDVSSIDDAGQVSSTPRSEEELEALRELVASAVGFNEERGDVITIKSMPLQSIPAAGTEAQVSLMDRLQLDVMSLVQMAVLAATALVLALFVIRPLLARAPQEQGVPLLANGAATGSTDDELQVADGEVVEPMGLNSISLDDDIDGLPDLPGLPAFGGGDAGADPVQRLRDMIGERQEESVQILRSWLEDERGEKVQ
jgi:flagellar M-ring protein FliF